MAGKLWRSRGRFVLSNVILFGLGVMTCLICLQMFATTGINDPIVYTNPEEYRLALQLKQPSPQQQQSENNNNVNKIDKNSSDKNVDGQQQTSVLCGSGQASATAKQVIDLDKNSKANANTKANNINPRVKEGNTDGQNVVINPNNNLKSSQLPTSTKNELGSQQDELKHFEGVAVAALPPDNNLNNDILNSKDLLLQEDNTDGYSPPGPTVWVVTPTFYRPEQKPELTRVAQALLPVSDFIHWIVVEDVSKGTDTSFEELKKFLLRFPLAVTVLKSLPPKSRIVGKPRGVGGRTGAIAWLRENAQEGVVYFADDDNTYDSTIFKQIGEIFNFTLSHVYDNFNHLLDDLNQPWLSNECLELYAEAIRRKGCPLQKCWGFVDGTVRAICRPGKYQKECYNGHKRVHALKYQSIVIPSGIIANLFGPIEGRRHDSFMLSESKILQDLEQKNLNEPEPFCIYGDPAYPLRAELQAPFKGSRLTPQQAAFNKKMSMSRISVEWAFEKVISLFAFVDFKKNQRLYLQPVGKYFKVAVILTNIHTCFNGSQVSSFFETEPLSVAECLTPRNQNE